MYGPQILCIGQRYTRIISAVWWIILSLICWAYLSESVISWIDAKFYRFTDLGTKWFDFKFIPGSVILQKENKNNIQQIFVDCPCQTCLDSLIYRVFEYTHIKNAYKIVQVSSLIKSKYHILGLFIEETDQLNSLWIPPPPFTDSFLCCVYYRVGSHITEPLCTSLVWDSLRCMKLDVTGLDISLCRPNFKSKDFFVFHIFKSLWKQIHMRLQCTHVFNWMGQSIQELHP